MRRPVSHRCPSSWVCADQSAGGTEGVVFTAPVVALMGNAKRFPVQSWYRSEVVNCDWYTTELVLRPVELTAADAVDWVAARMEVMMICRSAVTAAGLLAGKAAD